MSITPAGFDFQNRDECPSVRKYTYNPRFLVSLERLDERIPDTSLLLADKGLLLRYEDGENKGGIRFKVWKFSEYNNGIA